MEILPPSQSRAAISARERREQLKRAQERQSAERASRPTPPSLAPPPGGGSSRGGFRLRFRYIFLLLSAVTEMFEARRSRAVGGDQDTRQGQRFVAATAGALFGKSHALSEEVHQAMVARGYRGDARTLDGWRPGAIDGVWAVACVALALAALGGDRFLGG